MAASSGSSRRTAAPEARGCWSYGVFPMDRTWPRAPRFSRAGWEAFSPVGFPSGPSWAWRGGARGGGRTYLVRPAVPPGAVSHVMILTSRTTGAEDLHDAFQHTDSVP